MRLKAILRRTQKPVKQGGELIGPWRFDAVRGVLEGNSGSETLTAVETTLLKALLQKPGAIFTREELAEACNVDAGERTIDVQVTRLRKKIEENTRKPRYLQTVRGKGYVLHVD